jgi:hypothetical protein
MIPPWLPNMAQEEIELHIGVAKSQHVELPDEGALSQLAQMAGEFFGSEFTQEFLERARDRILELMSLQRNTLDPTWPIWHLPDPESLGTQSACGIIGSSG